MITTLVATFVLGAQSAQLPKLELSNPGVTFRNLAPEIEAQTGWKVKLSPEVENEVIVIRTAGRPAEETLAKIGEATLTTWELDDKVLIVTPDTAARQTAYAEQINRYWAAMAEGRTTLFQEYESRMKDEIEGENLSWPLLPSDYLMLKVIREFSIEHLRKIKFGDRRVYAINPNEKQLKLNLLNARAFLEVLPEVVESRKLSTEEIAELAKDMDFQQHLKKEGRTFEEVIHERNTVEPTKLLLSVTSSELGPITLNLFYVDKFRQKIRISETGFNNWDPGDAADTRIEPRTGDANPLTESQISGEISELSRYDREDLVRLILKPGIAEILTNPDSYEPLRYTGGELLLQAATKLDVPLIASLADGFDLTDSRIADIGSLRAKLKEAGYTEVFENRWWNIYYADKVANWQYRLDRRDLQNVISFNLHKMMSPIDNVANLLFKSYQIVDAEFVSSRLRLFSRWYSFLDTRTSLLRTFGGLSESQRTTLRNGGRVPISQVQPAVRAFIDRLTFGEEGKIVSLDQAHSVVVQGYFDEEDVTYERGLDVEPTEILPTGINEGYLEMRFSPGKYLIQKVDDPYLVRSVEPMTRSLFLLYSTFFDPERTYQRMIIQSPSFTQMRLGNYQDMELRIVLGAGSGHREMFQEYTDPYTEAIYGVQNLPDEVKLFLSSDFAEYSRTPRGKAYLEWRDELRANRTKRDPPPGASDLPANQG